ncbi:MAG: T9SS type A sorting domain-containing protein, partial [Candidatus Poribacteria bacterium]|nr:T9SS type A sorting domain-containing protein [Candidatus Poribacteria bacterium]
GHTDGVFSVAFSPDGNTLESWSLGDPIHLWDVHTGNSIRTLTGHTTGGESVSFSPEGNILASWSLEDGTIRLWDVQTGTQIHTLTGHKGLGKSVSFSPEGNILATGSSDATVRLWDVHTGNPIRTLTGHTHWVNSVSFSPDGNTLASGSLDGTILLWSLAPEPPRLAGNVNDDDEVNIQDLVAVAAALGQVGENAADVNGDGVVNIQDLVAVAAALGEVAAAPAIVHQQGAAYLTQEEVQHWLTQAQQANLTDATSLRGIRFLEQLLAAFTPKETALLPNYPNPFNPETWIPYQLSEPTAVTLTIHDIQGRVVRDLDLGHQRAGMYHTRSRAAYWDGRNAQGEPVASGVYFYTLKADDFSATRKLLIRK